MAGPCTRQIIIRWIRRPRWMAVKKSKNRTRAMIERRSEQHRGVHQERMSTIPKVNIISRDIPLYAPNSRIARADQHPARFVRPFRLHMSGNLSLNLRSDQNFYWFDGNGQDSSPCGAPAGCFPSTTSLFTSPPPVKRSFTVFPDGPQVM